MTVCEALHHWANSQPVLRFPFDDASIPLNGINVLFEQGEVAHGAKRIVASGRIPEQASFAHGFVNIFSLKTRTAVSFGKTLGAHC